MDVVLAVVIGLFVGLLLGSRLLWRRIMQSRSRRELDVIVSSRDPDTALRQLDERIEAQREIVAGLDEASGVLHAGGAEEHLHREHRELARLEALRERATEHFNSRRR